MNEATLVQEASRVLATRLPPGWKQRVKRLESRPQGRPDAILDVTGPDGAKVRLSVEAKMGLVPRAVADLKARLDGYSSNPGLVISTFLSRSTRERLRAENLNLPPPLPISDVAAQAKVDISYASRLVEWLSREALVERRPRGPVQSVDRAALIRRWAQDYEVLTSNDARGYLDPRGLDHFTRGLSGGAIRGRYALTGSIAANRIAPIAPARLAMLYVDNVTSMAAALNLRPTETGANVMLLAPFDDVVFERTWKDGGLTIVAASQAAVDLLTSPGRAPSEAEAILERLAGNAT